MDWMKEKREVIGLVINSMNRYAGVYTRSRDFGTGVTVSLSEVQALEIIIENPGINHTGLSNVLGVTRGAVSKGIRKLVSKGLISSRHNVGNCKNKCLYAEEAGSELYQRYTDYIQNNLFSKIFGVLDRYDESIPFIHDLFGEINNFLKEERVAQDNLTGVLLK